MPNFPAYVRRNSLFTTLFISILALAALSVVSSLTGWYLLENIRDSQQQLSVKTLPLVSAAQSMATQSAALAFISPQIIRTETEIILDELYFDLYQYLDEMEGIQNRLYEADLKQADGNVIQTTVSDLRDDFSLLREKISARIVFRQLVAGSVDNIALKNQGINKILDQKINEQADLVFQLASRIRQSGLGENNPNLDRFILLNQDGEILFGLNRSVIRLESLLRNLPETNTYLELQEIKSRIDFQLRAMVSQMVGLSDQIDKKPLSRVLSELYQQLNLKFNIEYLQRQLISQNLELLEIESRVESGIFYLNGLINEVVVQAEKNTAKDTSDAGSAIALGANILLGAATLSLIISILVVWVFVIRKVILPLAEVADSIRKLSKNQLDINIKSHTLVELSEISEALEVFRYNALALNVNKEGLLKSNQLLTRANDDLNAFVHVASHDLKTPLRGIQVLSDFIVADIKQEKFDEAESNLRLLQQRIVRVGQLLDSLLGYTTLQPLSGVARQVDLIALMQNAFSQNVGTVNFSLVLPQELPECHAVESDLIAIFGHLFGNAVRHHDREKGLITVYFKPTDDSYIFDVCDDGPGIALEFQEQIFNVLQKLQSKDEVEGSGVGLAYVKRLLESRGGKIIVISNPTIERGCRFVFHYPKMSIEV